MDKDLIEIAYEVAKKKYKKGKFKYRDLLSEIVKINSQYKNLGGDLYVDLISDIRFLSLGNEEWALQEFYKYDEFEKISSAMFGLDQEIIDPELEEELITNKVQLQKDDESEVIEEIILEEVEEEVEVDEEESKEDDLDFVDDIDEIDDISDEIIEDNLEKNEEEE